METLNHGLAILGVASKPLRGQTLSGDRHVFIEFPDGVLVAAIDGLGHGSEAASASQKAAETLFCCTTRTVISAIQRCHEQLQNTRGVVMSVASFNANNNSMTWLAVGNVEAYLLRADASKREKPFILMRGGVVGYSLPPLRAEIVAVNPGDTLIMATDGIRSGFSVRLDPRACPQEIADAILTRFAKDTDDAMVVVVRWNGRRK